MKVYLLEEVNNLGNCILSLINVIYLCKKEGVKFSTDLSRFWKKIPFIEVEKIPFFIREFDDKDKVSSNFFRIEFDITKEERFEIVQQHIKPYTNFSVTPVPQTTCIINIRSGDIFNSGGTHKSYVQPPFAFYKKIIDEEKYDKFLVITQQDKINPTISLVEQYSKKVEVQSPNLSETLSIILGASSFVASYTTFSQVLFFSNFIKKIYCLDYTDFFSFFGTCPKTEIVKYKFLKPYIQVGTWINSIEQLALMKNYDVKNIKRID
jgi:hypothetical protein